MKPDKQPILEKADIQEEKSDTVKTSKTFQWSYLLIAPICFFGFIGEGIFQFVVDEWTQGKIKKEYFSGVELLSNFSTCHIVNKTDPDYLNYKSVQQKSADWLMYYRFGLFIPELITNLILPAYSDSFGRRKIILLAMIGVCVKFSMVTVVVFTEAELYYIVIIYALQGLTGGTHSWISLSFSYMADITHGEKQRVQGIVFMDFVMVSSSLVATPMSGTLIQTLNLGFAYTGVICTGLIGASFILACLFLPETLDKSKRQPKKNVLATLKQSVAFYGSTEFQGKRLYYIVLMVIFIFVELSSCSRKQMEVLYLLGQPFCWGPAFIGYFSLARLAGESILGIIALKLLQMCLSSVSIASLSCLSIAGGLVIEGLARTDATIYCVPVAGMLGFLIFPMLRGLLSNLTAPDKQGSLFAGVGAIQTIGNLLAIPENEIYSATLSVMDGFIFLVLAFFAGCALFCLLFYCFIQPSQIVIIEPIKAGDKTATDEV